MGRGCSGVAVSAAVSTRFCSRIPCLACAVGHHIGAARLPPDGLARCRGLAHNCHGVRLAAGARTGKAQHLCSVTGACPARAAAAPPLPPSWSRANPGCRPASDACTVVEVSCSGLQGGQVAASRAPPQFVLLGQAVGGQAQLHALLAHPRLLHQLLGRGLPVRLVEPALGVARGHPAHGLLFG